MPRTPGTGGGRSLFRPSSPSTTTTSPGPKSPAIWPGWWPRPSGQVGGGRPVPPSPAAARIPVLFPSFGPPPSSPGPAHWLGDAMGDARRRRGGNAGLLFGQEPLVWAGGMRQIFYWTAEVDVCWFLCPPPHPVTNFVTLLHGVVFICGVFLIVLRSFPPQS